MVVCSKPYKKKISLPFKMSAGDKWMVTEVTDDKKESKVTLEFDNQEKAKTHFDNNNEKWFVNIFNENGEITSTKKFENYTEVKEYIKEHNKQEYENVLVKENNEVKKETDALEKFVGDDDFGNTKTDNIIKKYEEKVDEQTVKFNSDYEAAEKKAGMLIMSMAALFFVKKDIDENDLVKQRIAREAENLTSMVFQMDVAKQALHKLHVQIQVGTHSSKNFDALSALQRTILEISKQQHSCMDDIQDTLKSLKEEIKESNPDGSKGKISDIGDDVTEEAEEVISTNSRVQLIKEIRSIAGEIAQPKVPKSHNQNLHTDDETVSDTTEDIKLDDDIEIGAKSIQHKELGLESWDLMDTKTKEQ